MKTSSSWVESQDHVPRENIIFFNFCYALSYGTDIHYLPNAEVVNILHLVRRTGPETEFQSCIRDVVGSSLVQVTGQSDFFLDVPQFLEVKPTIMPLIGHDRFLQYNSTI
jgi:hypothetical protein